jgi:hypothetical protein
MRFAEVMHQNYHMQGFTTDGEAVYWSFTDSLVKTNLSSTVLGQVPVKTGHLGDITYYNGRIYGTVMGNNLRGKPWGEWTGFYVNVYDSGSLSLIDVLRLDDCYFMYEERTDGFRGIDGITVLPLEDGETHLMIACSTWSEERYDRQIILEYTLDGRLVDKHFVKTGNTMFGIQNLSRDSETGEYWFSTYGAEIDFQRRMTLYRVSADFELLGEYDFFTAYGFEPLGGGRFLASLEAGVNGNRRGYAYEVTEEFIEKISEKHMPEWNEKTVKIPWFDIPELVIN